MSSAMTRQNYTHAMNQQTYYKPNVFSPSNIGRNVAVSLRLNHPISKKIRLQQLKLLLQASRHHGSRRRLSGNGGRPMHNIARVVLEKKQSGIIAPSQENELTWSGFENGEEKENEPDGTNEEDISLSLSSSCASSYSGSPSSLTKQQLLTQLIQALSAQRPCPCECSKSNCLLLYCECYLLKKSKREALQKLRLQPSFPAQNACHPLCKCQRHHNQLLSKRTFPSLRLTRISSHPIATRTVL